jgi:hypothetical protein
MPIVRRVVDVIVDGAVVQSEEVVYFRLPWTRPMSDQDCISNALDDLWHGRFEPPAGATYRVREP